MFGECAGRFSSRRAVRWLSRWLPHLFSLCLKPTCSSGILVLRTLKRFQADVAWGRTAALAVVERLDEIDRRQTHVAQATASHRGLFPSDTASNLPLYQCMGVATRGRIPSRLRLFVLSTLMISPALGGSSSSPRGPSAALLASIIVALERRVNRRRGARVRPHRRPPGESVVRRS